MRVARVLLIVWGAAALIFLAYLVNTVDLESDQGKLLSSISLSVLGCAVGLLGITLVRLPKPPNGTRVPVWIFLLVAMRFILSRIPVIGRFAGHIVPFKIPEEWYAPKVAALGIVSAFMFLSAVLFFSAVLILT